MNNVNLFGRLTAEPETRETASGVKVSNFKLAVSRTKEDTDFFTIVAWRERAEFCEKYLEKGMQCAVSGTLTTRRYEDKEGRSRLAFEIVASNINPVFKQKEEVKEQRAVRRDLEPVEDDLPF